jgi:hypothetical protein
MAAYFSYKLGINGRVPADRIMENKCGIKKVENFPVTETRRLSNATLFP